MKYFNTQNTNQLLLHYVAENIVCRDVQFSSHSLYKLVKILEKIPYPLKLDASEIFFDYKDIQNIYNLSQQTLKFSQIHYLTDYNNLYKKSLRLPPIIHLYYFYNLRELNFPNNRNITDIEIKNMTQLKILILPKNKNITDKALLKLNKLQHIDLEINTNITDIGLYHKNNLEYIKMRFNKNLTDNAFTNMSKLVYINLGYNNNRKLTLEFLRHNKKVEDLIMYKKKILSPEICEYIVKNIPNITFFNAIM